MVIYLAKMNKKKAIDLLAYSMLLFHNNKGEFIEEEIFSELMKYIKSSFNDKEVDAIKYLEEKASSIIVDLKEHLNSK